MAEPRNVLHPHSEDDMSCPRNTPRPSDQSDAEWQSQNHDEYSPLLPPTAGSAASGDGWDDAVLKGLIDTTWRRETILLTRSAAPLVLTFVLQYSLTVASIFTVSHIGTIELGAVSLAHSTPPLTTIR
jgi:MATE family multidrug resistance protein